MKTYLILGLLILIGCQQSEGIKEKELILKEKELKIREAELAKKEDSLAIQRTNAKGTTSSFQNSTIKVETISGDKKFIFMVLKVRQPTLLTVTNEQKYFTDPNGFSLPLGDKYSYTTIMETNYYTSEVVEINGYTKNKQYKTMDKFEFQIQEKINEDDRQYRFDVDTKVFSNRDGYYTYQSEIVSRKCYVYNSYQEASIERKKSRRF